MMKFSLLWVHRFLGIVSIVVVCCPLLYGQPQQHVLTTATTTITLDTETIHRHLNVSQARRRKRRLLYQARRTASTTTLHKIDPSKLPKYVTELYIPPVLHDDQGKDSHVEISFRQFTQQMLPDGYPRSPVWGYGIPSNPFSFHHPSGTIEVTRYKKTYITWRNELLANAAACRSEGFRPTNRNCHFVKHVLQDRSGTPVVDTSLHWAAPDRKCANGKNETDCYGPLTPSKHPYWGPIPMVPHVHGAHVESRSDGYPESWFLPRANNIPRGYATVGSYFRSRYLPSAKVKDDGNRYVKNATAGDKFFQPAANQARGKGYAVYRYTNDQESTSLFYHDHSLGLTRLNMYAGGAGFYLIRTHLNGESRMATLDVKKKPQQLPGPPARAGQDPNKDPTVRKQIREVPLVIQDKDFYSDGRLFYPANRLFFDFPGCSDGTNYGSSDSDVRFFPHSDISPIWNPEAFFFTMLVNGKAFPKFTVAPERYRFRILNACDSRTLNLAFKVGSINSKNELPFFVIGSDQGLLPQVVKVRTGFATKMTPGKYPSTAIRSANQHGALLLGPGERYDIIVDFHNLAHGSAVYMINTGPDSPFGGLDQGDDEEYEPADPKTSGQVMKFVISNAMKKSKGDTSTSPYNLVLGSKATTGKNATVVRRLSVAEYESKKICVTQPRDSTPCRIPRVSCASSDHDPFTGVSSYTYGPIHANLGYGGNLGPGKLTSQRWMDPINQNPAYGSTEIWELWNWTGDAHPLHFHLTAFTILGRFDMKGNRKSGPMAVETGRKDTVLALPGQVTRIQLTFDIAGVYVWHCHILSHEDNEMMVPYCVGKKGVDCPARLF